MEPILEPNCSFFGTITLDVLMPCVLFHYFSRCGQLLGRNMTLTRFIPVMYATGKLNFQHALFQDTLEKITMAERAHKILYVENGTLCNILGNHGNDLHNDEGLESCAVKPSKLTAGNNKKESLELSFFTQQNTSQKYQEQCWIH